MGKGDKFKGESALSLSSHWRSRFFTPSLLTWTQSENCVECDYLLVHNSWTVPCFKGTTLQVDVQLSFGGLPLLPPIARTRSARQGKGCHPDSNVFLEFPRTHLYR